jgi:hypothetical protein
MSLRKGSRRHRVAGNVLSYQCSAWPQARCTRRSEIPSDQCSRWRSNVLFGDNGHGWGRSHARARRCFWRTTHRAASLAHVLCAVFSPQAPFSWDSNKYSPALLCSGAGFAVAVRGLQSWPRPRRRKWFLAIHMRRAPLLNRRFWYCFKTR